MNNGGHFSSRNVCSFLENDTYSSRKRVITLRRKMTPGDYSMGVISLHYTGTKSVFDFVRGWGWLQGERVLYNTGPVIVINLRGHFLFQISIACFHVRHMFCQLGHFFAFKFKSFKYSLLDSEFFFSVLYSRTVIQYTIYIQYSTIITKILTIFQVFHAQQMTSFFLGTHPAILILN